VQLETTKPFFQLDNATQNQIVQSTNRVILNKDEMIANDDLIIIGFEI